MADERTGKETEQKLRDIQFALNESCIVAITDEQGIIQYVNDKFCKVSKYSQEELIGNRHSMINSGYHPESFFKAMWKTITSGEVWKGEIKNRKKDGTCYWVDTTIVPFLNQNGKPYQYVSIRYDITDRKNCEEMVRKLAYADPLTKLPNRNQLVEWMKESMRDEGDTVTAFFIDIDQFKSINDHYGHTTGDLVLQEVAVRLKNSIRKTDFISRQGGDEFIIILNNNDTEEEVTRVAERVLSNASEPIFYKNTQIHITLSIGISMGSYRKDIAKTDFIETLIRQADTAMYQVKKQAGNSYCFSTSDQNTNMMRTYQLEAEIKHALDDDEFYMVYQPIVNLQNNQVVGTEALLRWNNERLGHVSPGEFIPILEKQLLIIPVGNWVIRTVAAQMKKWQDEGIFFERVSINISPIQLKDRSFVKHLQQILNETQVDPSYIELEITESTLLEVQHSAVLFEQLQALGIKISIDDFGTGYSSLSYLKKLPINTMKIDKSFIDDLDHHGKVLANTIISMGKNLGYRVIAEGIETKEQLAFLKKQNSNEGQGYYFSKPVKSEEIAKLLKKSRNRN